MTITLNAMEALSRYASALSGETGTFTLVLNLSQLDARTFREISALAPSRLKESPATLRGIWSVGVVGGIGWSEKADSVEEAQALAHAALSSVV